MASPERGRSSREWTRAAGGVACVKKSSSRWVEWADFRLGWLGTGVWLTRLFSVSVTLDVSAG